MHHHAARARWLLWAFAAAPLVVFAVVPLAVLGWRSLGAGSVSAIDTLSRPETWSLLARSLTFAGLVSVLATLIGGAAGYALAAGGAPSRLRGPAQALLVLPLILPPYVHAVGWTTLLAPNRPLCDLLARTLAVAPASVADAMYSFPAAVIVLALAFFPIPMLFIRAALSSAPYTLVEAAQNCGAGPWRTFLTARWPFLSPAAGSAALIVFLLASADLGVPTILKVPVFNLEVFTQLGAFNDTAAAMLLALPLVGAGLLAVWVERRNASAHLVRADDRDGTRDGSESGRTTAVAALLVALLLLSLVLPLGAIIAEGLNREALTRAIAIARMPAWFTVAYAGSAAAIVAAMGFAIAWLARSRDRSAWAWGGMTDWLLVLGFATPGSILALALLSAYGTPAWSRVAPPVVLVVAALVVRLAVVGHRIIDAGVAAVPDSYIEAAQLAGASSFRIARSIVAPLIAPHLVAALAAVFILAASEIGSTILLHPPGGETLPIALYAVEANSPRSLVAAMTLLAVAIPLATVALAAGTFRILKKQ